MGIRKQGIDFYPQYCNTTSIEEAILGLMAGKGETLGYKALYIRHKLLSRIYADKGYYMQADQDTLKIFANRHRFPLPKLIELINICIKYGDFDQGILEEHSVLTGTKIQEIYFNVTKRRDYSNFASQLPYLLIDVISLLKIKQSDNEENNFSNVYSEDATAPHDVNNGDHSAPHDVTLPPIFDPHDVNIGDHSAPYDVNILTTSKQASKEVKEGSKEEEKNFSPPEKNIEVEILEDPKDKTKKISKRESNKLTTDEVAKNIKEILKASGMSLSNSVENNTAARKIAFILISFALSKDAELKDNDLVQKSIDIFQYLVSESPKAKDQFVRSNYWLDIQTLAKNLEKIINYHSKNNFKNGQATSSKENNRNSYEQFVAERFSNQ